jgi:flavin-dependent dehydrogenase
MIEQPEETDVLVIGGVTTGFSAAVAAGRQGLNDILLEATSKVGGVIAFCPGMPGGGGYPVDQKNGGLIEELTVRLEGVDTPAAEKRPYASENFGPKIVYEHDIATLTTFEMLEEAGVNVRLNATAVAPDMDASRIETVPCYGRNGPFTTKPKIVINCPGVADISTKVGVPYALGDESGNMMAVTISFHTRRHPDTKSPAKRLGYYRSCCTAVPSLRRHERPQFARSAKPVSPAARSTVRGSRC